MTLAITESSQSQENNEPFALVELFTSEGCSSCPPADEFLIDLANKSKETGQEIYTLGFHINYWDYLGWKDSFAQPEFNERQQMYGQKLKDNTYTPQMIINGKYSLVGNNRSKALKLINQSLTQKPSCQIDLSQLWLDNIPPTGSLTYKITNAPKDFFLNIAFMEDIKTSYPTSGENAGKILIHIGVVRNLESLTSNETFGKTPYPYQEGKALTAVAFVQDKETAEILCAQEINPN